MSLSAEQYDWLQQISPKYRYIGHELENKTLTCVASPSGGGKSKIISKIIELSQPEDDIAEANTMTPRPRRPDDPAGYLTGDEDVTNESMIRQIKANTLVNFNPFETGLIYGTSPASYPGRHNMLPTMTSAIPMLSRAAFQSMHIIYIVRPVEDWIPHITQRTMDPKQRGRIIEAKKSLEYARNANGIIRVVNYEDDTLLERTAKGLLEIATTDQQGYRAGILDDYHEREFDIHRRDMENYVDEFLRTAGIEV